MAKTDPRISLIEDGYELEAFTPTTGHYYVAHQQEQRLKAVEECAKRLADAKKGDDGARRAHLFWLRAGAALALFALGAAGASFGVLSSTAADNGARLKVIESARVEETAGRHRLDGDTSTLREKLSGMASTLTEINRRLGRIEADLDGRD